MTIKNRILLLLRRLGYYKGPIHHVIKVKVTRLGLTGQDIG